MKIVILGSDSVFGKSLIENLAGAKLQLLPLAKKDGLNLMNFGKTRKMLADLAPDFIYNLESFGGGIHFAGQYFADIVHVNMQMAINLYRAVALASPKSCVVNILANCSYPGDAVIQREPEWFDGQVHESVLAYGSVKRMQYVLAYCYKKQYGVKSRNFIIPNHFGPGDYTDPARVHAIGGMIIRMIGAKRGNDKKFEIWGSGKPVREWGYIDDIARVLAKGLEVGEDLTYPVNIGQRKGYSIAESAKLIARAVGFGGKLVFDTKYQDGAPKKVLDNRRFKKIFGDFKFTDHWEAIVKTVDYYQSVLR